MEIIHKVDIDLLKPGAMQMIFAMQADENSRVLEISLSANGEVWNIPEDISFSVAYLKPDKTRGIYDTLPDGTSAATFSENVVSVKLAPQMLTAHGMVQASVVMTDSAMNRLNTFPVTVNVIANPSVGATESKDYYSLTAIAAIGDLNDLETNDKSSVVAAINEILAGGTGGGSGSNSSQNPTVDLTDYAKTEDLPTKVSDLENDKGYLTEHQDISGKLDASELPAAINTALAQAKASGEFDGADGQPGEDGNGIKSAVLNADYTLTLTFDDGTSYTTPSIRGATGSAGKDGQNGSNGSDGVGISSIEQTTTSTADGGNNVFTVTLDNGTTATFVVRNGSKGSTGGAGVTGKSAYQYAQEQGYAGTETEFGIKLAKDIPAVTQEAGESETLVMSQKAVKDLVNDALGQNESVEYETVDSVDDMTDTTTQYILSSTNTLWAYGEVEVEPTELYDPAAATLNIRHSGSPGSVVTGNSYVMTDYIPVDMAASEQVLLKITCDGFSATATAVPYFQKMAYYDSGKTCLGTRYVLAGATSGNGVKLETSGNDTTVFVGYVNNESQETFYSQIAFVRIEVKSTNSPAVDADRNLITSIMLANSVTGYGWYDTELAPSTGNDGGNYVTLLLKIEQNKTDIDYVSKRVANLESGTDTVTVPTFWQDAVNICISKIKALQVGRNCVTFPFFSDNHQRNGYAGALIRAVMDECHIPYCMYGGDSIDSGYIASEAVMIAQDAAFDSMMSAIPNGRLCRAVGNHDGYWAVSADEKYTYTRDQVYELFLREESVAQNKHFGDDGTYYYVEDLASKVRFIVLNTNGGSVDDTQLSWLQDVALKVSEGWAAVFISHQPISNHYHANISNAADVREVVTESGVDVIGWFSGHIHRDRIYTGVATNTTDDTEGDSMGFTQVTITSDHTGIAYDDATKHTVASDDQSHAIDFVTVNRATRTVSMTRLGIGEDRSYTY